MTLLPETSAAAMLEHLTGPSRGTCSWVATAEAEAWLDPSGRLQMVLGGDAPPGRHLAARFRRSGPVFVIEAPDEGELWVNRQPVRRAELRHGDMIEFGATGPLSRFRIYDDQRRPFLTVGQIVGDSVSYMRASRRPLRRRLPRAGADLVRRLLGETTLLFRGGVVAALVLLTVAVALQFRADRRLRAEIDARSLQVDSIAAAIAEARRDAIREADLRNLSTELGARMDANAQRLETLEARSGAQARIISAATGWVAFLQGGYGLRDPDSGRMLRRMVGANGAPLLGPGGQPRLTLEGDGPVAEVQFNGTGFLLNGTGLVVTNRHVARPWETKPGIGTAPDALEPVLTRFVAFFPGRPDPVDVVEAGVSEAADLAVLSAGEGQFGPGGLDLAERPPLPGEQIVVMGYPTGLMSLLAQSGRAFVDDLRAAGDTGFWTVAMRLSEAGLIAPLSSGGIVAQATEAAVVYDAETTHGGSGGPVLNLRGRVVAVNAAIIPEFGGANLGVPSALIAPLLSPPEG